MMQVISSAIGLLEESVSPGKYELTTESVISLPEGIMK
jgi:hypothetical protein